MRCYATLALLTLGMTGCGGGLSPLEGTVFVDGKPVPSAKPKRPQFPKEYYQNIQIITVENGHNEIDLILESTNGSNDC